MKNITRRSNRQWILTLLTFFSLCAVNTTAWSEALPPAPALTKTLSSLQGRYRQIENIRNGKGQKFNEETLSLYQTADDTFVLTSVVAVDIVEFSKNNTVRILNIIRPEPKVSFQATVSNVEATSFQYNTLKDGNYFDVAVPKYEGLGEGNVRWTFDAAKREISRNLNLTNSKGETNTVSRRWKKL